MDETPPGCSGGKNNACNRFNGDASPQIDFRIPASPFPVPSVPIMADKLTYRLKIML
jgi:hypothetical protein